MRKDRHLLLLMLAIALAAANESIHAYSDSGQRLEDFSLSA